MSSKRFAVVIFLLGSSFVDLTYTWRDPIEALDGPIDWYSDIGLSGGYLLTGSYEFVRPGWSFGFTARPPISPIVIGAGPGGAYVGVALWTLVLGGVLVSFILRELRRRLATRD
jgi:hypothetical protein